MTLKEFYRKYSKQIDRYISQSLKEDRVNNDVTTNLLFESGEAGKIVTANLLCKEVRHRRSMLAGLEIFKRIYRILDRKVRFEEYYKDGDRVGNKTVVLKVKSPLNVLLAGERVSLNFLQRMSGIATLTNEFVKKLKYEHSKILHTRKTTPNFRLFEAMAVKIGGGDFHRLDLGSAVMIKDNHIIAAGSLEKVLDRLHKKKLSSNPPGADKNRFEVEVKTFLELKNVIKKGGNFVKIIMLDNFSPNLLNKAIKLIKQSSSGRDIKIEISGGLTLENFAAIQCKGVDYYSIGMLTHSYKSVDFSLEF